MSWFNKLFNGRKKQHSKLYSDLYLKRLGKIQTYSDRGDTYIEEGYQNNPIVYSIVNIAAKNGATARWVCKDRKTGEPIKNYSNVEYALKALMSNPSPDKCWEDFIKELITQKVLTGNAFAAVSRYGSKAINGLSGRPSELFMMPSNEIQIWLNDPQNSIEQFVLDFQGSNDSPEYGVKAKDVLHVRSDNPDYSIEGDFLWGQSPFRAARRSIQTYNDSLETGVWLLQNRGAETILVNQDADLELSNEAVDALKSKLREQAQSPKNAGNMPIIDANLGVLNVGGNADDILLLQQRQQAAVEICNSLNFPVQLIGIENATYQNAKEAKKALWQNVIIPELEEIKNGLNRWLAPQFSPRIYLDYELYHIDALKEDRPLTELANLATVNEARKRAGLEPTQEAWGNEMYVGFLQGTMKDLKGNESKGNGDE